MPPSSEAGAAAGVWEHRARTLDPRLARVAYELFGAAREVLTVGVRAALEPCTTTFLEEPAQAACSGQDFDGALWLLSASAGKRAAHRTREPAERTDAGAREGSPRALAGASDGAAGLARAGLALLRPRLRPGATILLIASSRAPALAQLRALLLVPLARASARFEARERDVQRPSIASLCEGALLAGLCAPRVHRDHPGWLAVSARLPRERSALDSFFEQPAPAARR